MASLGLNARLRGFGTSIFSEMTVLANKHNAVNLGQGFPNFNPRGKLGKRLLDSAALNITDRGLNQYARSFGDLNLAKAVASRFERTQGLRYDPVKEVTVFTGATEGIYCAFNALLELGDEGELVEIGGILA
jgi:aspartate/methionine/tyrosine aminotransferase